MNKINYDVFIKGDLIDLVCLNEEVVEKSSWYNWFNDEENMKYMQKHYYPNTKALQLEFFKNEIANNPKKLQLGILHKKDGILIGTISLNDIDFLNRKCEISGFIGETKYQTLVYFVEANKLLIKHAFEQLNMNKIYGGSFSKEIAQIFIRTLNFEEEGIKQREIYKNGQYNDIYLIGLLRERFFGKDYQK